MADGHDGSKDDRSNPDERDRAQRLLDRVAVAVTAVEDQQATAVIFGGLGEFFPKSTPHAAADEPRLREYIESELGKLTKEERGTLDVWKRLTIEALRMWGMDERAARALVDPVVGPSALCWELRESNEIRELARQAAKARLDGRDEEASKLERRLGRRIDDQIDRGRP